MKSPFLSCIIAILIAASGSAYLSTFANANQSDHQKIVLSSCGDRETVIKSLKQDYKEVQDSIGVSNGGGLIEVFVSPRGSFSITVTSPSKITCIISAGDHWNKNNSLASLGKKT
jgi:hypothetical protein